MVAQSELGVIGGVSCGKINADSCPDAEGRADGNKPVVSCDDRITYGKAQAFASAGSHSLCGEIGVKYAGEVLRGNTDPLVFKGDVDEISVWEKRYVVRTGGREVTSPDCEAAPLGHGLFCINDDI